MKQKIAWQLQSPVQQPTQGLSNQFRMPKILRTIAIAATTVLVSLTLAEKAWTNVEYDSDQLQMKNAEQVSDIIKKKIKTAENIQAKQTADDDAGAQADPDAIASLRDGMRIILSRPDQDGTRENVFLRLRRELDDLNSFSGVMQDLATEGIDGLKSDSTPLRIQATYVVMLENLLSEIKPEVNDNATFKKIVLQIRDADIKISEKLRLDRKLHNMSKVPSPSDSAAVILPKAKK